MIRINRLLEWNNIGIVLNKIFSSVNDAVASGLNGIKSSDFFDEFD